MDYKLYEIDKDAICINCGHKGAICYFGTWYPSGLGEKADTLPPPYNKYKDTPQMMNAMGFGGTIPYECTNCGNIGLINMTGLEGYKKAFIKE